MRNVRRLILGTVALVMVAFAPQLWLQVRFGPRIVERVADVPEREFGVVFGARVRGDGEMSDAARERVQGAVALVREGRVSRLFVSGDDRNFAQARVMAAEALRLGVPRDQVVVDGLGIDTNDTCKHFARLGGRGVLVSQAFHLPRAMWMCERAGVASVGLAVNRLGLLQDRGGGAVAVWRIRVWRFVREAALSWLFLLGLYDLVSGEAERATPV